MEVEVEAVFQAVLEAQQEAKANTTFQAYQSIRTQASLEA
jgi:hypothetical protein